MNINVDSFDFGTITIIDANGQYEEFDLRQELKVNEANLLKEMLEQPGKYIYWSSILEKLKFYQEQAEMELELLEARLEPEARAECKENEAKPTKDMIAACIKRKPEYEEARNKVLNYEYIIGRVTRVVKAFEQRKDMLQSYGKQVIDNAVYGRGAGTHVEQNPFNRE